MAATSNSLKYDALNLAIASGDTIKLACYTSSATIDATTAAYSATNESSSSGTGYTAGGFTLSNRTISASDGSASTAYVDWDNVTFTPTATFTFQKVLVYNASKSNRALWYHDYGSTQTWNSGTAYTLTVPDSGNGLIRLA